jgi:hypothetical protein
VARPGLWRYLFVLSILRFAGLVLLAIAIGSALNITIAALADRRGCSIPLSWRQA